MILSAIEKRQFGELIKSGYMIDHFSVENYLQDQEKKIYNGYWFVFGSTEDILLMCNNHEKLEKQAINANSICIYANEVLKDFISYVNKTPRHADILIEIKRDGVLNVFSKYSFDWYGIYVGEEIEDVFNPAWKHYTYM